MAGPSGTTMPPALTYDVASDSINLAFDNPGYATHHELESQPIGATGRQAPPLPTKLPIGKNDTNANMHPTENGGFENPGYETMGATGTNEGEYETLPSVKDLKMNGKY